MRLFFGLSQLNHSNRLPSWWLLEALLLLPGAAQLLAISLFISTSTEDKQGRIKGEDTQTRQFFSLLAVLVKTW